MRWAGLQRAVACAWLILAAPCAWAEYQPEVGYGPFDRQVQENRLIVANVARQIDLSPDLLVAVAATESGFAGKARSDKGAVGVMQVMPPTAREVASELGLEKWSLEDPFHNALIGGLYLKKMLARYKGDVSLALAAYNAGPNNVDDWINRSPRRASGADIVKRRAFGETRGYVHEVISRAGAGAVGVHRVGGGSTITNGALDRYACIAGADDTLCSIARRYGIGIRDLWQLNYRRLNSAGDGVIVVPGQVVWLRPLPLVLAYSPERRGALKTSDVEILINKAGHYLELVAAGTVIRHFNLDVAGGSSAAGIDRPRYGSSPIGEYYICRRGPDGRMGQRLQLSYPNESDAWTGLMADKITCDEYDGIIDCLSRGEAPPSSTALGGDIFICGRNTESLIDGTLSLDEADADELFALTPDGARVVVLPGD